MPIHGKTIQYENPPMGLNQAVIAGVYDIGTQEFIYQGETSINPQIVIVLELAAKMKEGENAGKPFTLFKYENLYMSKNAKLRKNIAAILGKTMSDDEAKRFDVESLVGTNTYVSLIDNNGKAKIDSFIAYPSDQPKIKPTLTKEPEFITKKRGESLEAKGTGPRNDAPPREESDLPNW